MNKAAAAAALAFVCLSRWLTAPAWLHSFDAVNFALALDDFDPGRHQPQPPGYVLFVALTKLIHAAVTDAASVLAIAGIVGSCAAVLLAGMLAKEMSGAAAGLAAMALTATHPVMWFGSITNPVRVFLAVSSFAVALAAWRAMARPDRPARLSAAFAVLGVAGGFRPEAVVVLLPLLVWVWRRCGASWMRLGAGLATAAGLMLCWFAISAAAVGGASTIWIVFRAYVLDQFRGSSALFGAGSRPAAGMAAAALAWTFLGAVAWAWALPFVRRRLAAKGRGPFLLAWLIPPLLFNAAIHIGDPDQALAGVAPVVVAGAVVLALLPRPGLASGLAAAVHVGLFFFPAGQLMRSTSYSEVRDIAASNRDVLQEVERLREGGPLTIVSWTGPVTFRHLAYYFPDDYVVLLPGSPGEPAPGAPVHVFHRRRPLPPPLPTGVLHPGSRRVAAVAPPGSLAGWTRSGRVFSLDLDRPAEIAVGPHRLLRGR